MINLQDIINKVTASVEAEPVKMAEAAPAVAEPIKVAEAAPATPAAEADLQKVATEMDEAGRVMARAFYDEFQKIAVSAHGYVDSPAEQGAGRTNPAVAVSFAPERMENAGKAIQILTQLTAGERMKGPEGYIQVNGQPVDGTAPEIAVEEHPVAVDSIKRADGKLLTALYTHYFPEA
jgi:hypothetical protein